MLKNRFLRQLSLAAAASVLLTVTGVLSYRLSERAGMATLRGEAYHRLDLFAAAIDGTVNRYAHVPATLPLNVDVGALMHNQSDPFLLGSVNLYLERLNASIGSIAIFLMNADGLTLASSNWNQPDSFVGEDLSFRPYFEQARAGKPARYYAIGTTRGEPGYFVSHPIVEQGEIIGVAVIKIGLRPLINEGWSPAETPALIADRNGVVILASVPNWRLTALMPLTPEQLKEIERTRQYNREPIGRFPTALQIESPDAQVVTFPAGGVPGGNRDFLALSRRLPDNGWRLTVFSNLRPVHTQAWNAVALAETATACVLLFMLFLWMRRRSMKQKLEAQAMLQRAYAELERKVDERTADLVEANTRLRAEVSERERAETTLRAAQDELVQAAKLAVLGQLATGITHELTQPLGALRALSENAVEFMRRGDMATLAKNLEIISNLAQRMGAIIGQLKAFARKSPSSRQRVDVSQSIANAQFLLDQRLHHASVKVDKARNGHDAIAWCDPVRLEQVLVNLMGNAIDAMSGTTQRVLTLRIETSDTGEIAIRVGDTGPGLPREDCDRIFEPFFTTKPSGEGLGLGLAISRDIVRDFGGSLSAHNLRGGGAEFVINLPRPPVQE